MNNKKNICAVIGDPIEHSLSPAIHNACYRNLNIDDNFFFKKILITKDELRNIKNIISQENLLGISVTSPYKINIIDYLDEIDEFSQKIGAVNTVLNKNGKLFGYNTDGIGILNALKNNLGDIANKNVAVFGSSGTAKSAVIGLLGM